MYDCPYGFGGKRSRCRLCIPGETVFIDIVYTCSSRLSGRQKLISRKQAIDIVCVVVADSFCGGKFGEIGD